jgi:hypothetical protein
LPQIFQLGHGAARAAVANPRVVERFEYRLWVVPFQAS